MKFFKYVNNDITYLVSISYVLSKIWGKDFKVKQEMYFGPVSVIKNENGKSGNAKLLVYLGVDGKVFFRDANFNFIANLDDFLYLPISELLKKKNISYSDFVATIIKDYDNVGLYLNCLWNSTDIPKENTELLTLWYKLRDNYFPSQNKSIPILGVLAKFSKPLKDSLNGDLLISPVVDLEKGYFIRQDSKDSANGDRVLSSETLYDMVRLGLCKLCDLEKEKEEYKSYEDRLEEQLKRTRK